MQPTPRHRDDVRSIIHASVADMRASFHAEIEQNARAKLRASLAKVQRHRVEVGGEHPDATTLERFNADSARRSPEGGGDAPPATPEGTEPGIIDLDAGDDEGDDGDGGVGKDDADGDADADEDAMDVIDLDLERPAVVVEVGHAIDGGVLPGTLPKRLPLAPAAVQARIQLESPAESAAENEVEAEVEAVPPLVVIPMQPYLAVAHGEVTRVAFSDLEIRTSARVSKGGGGGGARRRKRKGGGGGGNKSGGHRTVSLTHVNPVPMYNAWVPIKNEFWCGKDFFREPHMPFYGDEESQRKKSLNVYANMVVALGGPARGTHEDPQEEVSDGELDSSGHFIPPGDEDADGWMAYHSLAERRAREVTRAVILQVHREIPLEGNVVAVAALVQALGLRSPRHVRKHLQRALVEERRAAEATEKFVATRKVRHRLKDAMEVDVGYADDVDEAWFADHAPLPLEGFCFTCHTFSCRQHEGHNVEPVVPIKDAGVERRNAAIAAIRMAVAAGVKIGMSEASGEDSDGSYDGREPDRSGGSDGSAGASVAVYRDPVVAICGKNCHLDSKWLSSPPNPSCCSRPSGGSDGGIDEGGGLDGEVNWTLEERLIVREAIAVFKNDACSIARTMGGSKTCRETATYMKGPEMAFVVRKIVSETTKKRWPREVNRGGDGAVDEVLLGKEDGAGSSSTRDKHAAQNSQRQGQVSCCGGEDVDLDEIKDFVPCAHTGPCDKAACSCFQNNLDCEATCGCNNGRWTDKRGYVAGTNGEHNWRKICIRRHLGCVCRPGDNCSTEKCACWVANRACDPDFCQTCEAGPLPDMIHPRQRSCRNVGALTGWHKKTHVGNSEIIGYGLFAGDVFEKGDIVGIYGGGVMDTNLAEANGFLYDASDHTFMFDLTEKLTVDGGDLGMKTKFCNFANAGTAAENVISRHVNVRGCIRIVLSAKRRIAAGEEFLFDYQFTDVMPDWAKRPESDDGLTLAVTSPNRSGGDTDRQDGDGDSSEDDEQSDEARSDSDDEDALYSAAQASGNAHPGVSLNKAAYDATRALQESRQRNI